MSSPVHLYWNSSGGLLSIAFLAPTTGTVSVALCFPVIQYFVCTGWVGLGFLPGSNNWPETDMIICWVPSQDLQMGAPICHDYHNHFNSHPAPGCNNQTANCTDTYGASPLLDVRSAGGF